MQKVEELLRLILQALVRLEAQNATQIELAKQQRDTGQPVHSGPTSPQA